MARVVLDTNVLVSAMMSGIGASSATLRSLAFDRYDLALSAAMVLEYEEVLTRMSGPGRWSAGDVRVLLDFVCQVGQPFRPDADARPRLRDADDEFVIELAVASAADYIVTNNLRDFAGIEKFGVVPLTPGQFVRVLELDR